MIRIVLITFILSISLLAQECSQYIKQIKNLDEQLFQSQKECPESSSQKSCKQTLEEAKLEYNGILAKLVIIDGLQTLATNLEDSHEKLRGLKTKDLVKANQYINDFEKNMNKNTSLMHALKPIDTKEQKYMFDEFKGNSKEQIKHYIDEKCKAHNLPFCKVYKNANNQDEIEKTLTGFFNTYNNISQKDKFNDFPNFRKYLQITSASNQSSEVFPKAQYDKIQELKKYIKIYAKDKNNKEASAKIVYLSKELEKVKTNYHNDTIIHNSTLKAYAKDKIKRSYTDILNATALLTRKTDVYKNLKNTNELLEADKKIAEQSFINDIKKEFNLEDCNSTISCYQLASSSPLFLSIGGKSFQSRIKKLKKYDQHTKALLEAQICYESNANNFESCVRDVIKKNSFHIETAKDKLIKSLKDQEKVIEKLSHDTDIKNIEMEKYEAIARYMANDCSFEQYNTEISMITCKRNLSIHNSILKLSDNILDITLKVDQTKLQEAKKYIDQKMVSTKENLDNNVTKKSTNDKEDKQSIFSTKNINKENKTAKTMKAGKRAHKKHLKKSSRHKSSTHYSNNNGAYFAAGLSNSLARGIPIAMNHINMHRRIDSQMEYNRMYYQWYKDNYSNMNWGFNNYNPYSSSNFNYNNPYLYYNYSANYPQYTYGSTNYGSSFQSSASASSSPFSFSF
ncbi:MAG: hypothetical protein N4A33_03170 [Bacteriovoracaceae bacterium]|jgi:hypothetical protein|nr:hypothetical protein [Bacteriovoracaceae bacterium]